MKRGKEVCGYCRAPIDEHDKASPCPEADAMARARRGDRLAVAVEAALHARSRPYDALDAIARALDDWKAGT